MKTWKILFLLILISGGMSQCDRLCPCDDPESVQKVKNLLIAGMPDEYFMLVEAKEMKDFLDKRVEIYNPYAVECNIRGNKPIKCSFKMIYDPIKIAGKVLSPEEMKSFEEIWKENAGLVMTFDVQYTLEPYKDQYLIGPENTEEAAEWIMSMYLMDVILNEAVDEVIRQRAEEPVETDYR